MISFLISDMLYLEKYSPTILLTPNTKIINHCQTPSLRSEKIPVANRIVRSYYIVEGSPHDLNIVHDLLRQGTPHADPRE
ncbi:hypothetical protein AVEN_114195-1, partial [Araneus ventricosus]